MRNQITVKCSISFKEYTGKQLNRISETPAAARYWDTIFGEYNKDTGLRTIHDIYVNTKTWNNYIIEKK